VSRHAGKEARPTQVRARDAQDHRERDEQGVAAGCSQVVGAGRVRVGEHQPLGGVERDDGAEQRQAQQVAR
jgi:hypothetical protein